MTQRVQLTPGHSKSFKALLALAGEITRAGADAGLDPLLLELIKIRASQVNGCAACLDMHTADAVQLGENPHRIFMLDAWRETELFTEQERSAIELTEVITRLSQTQDVPDEVYQRAMTAFTEAQYVAVGWMIMLINCFNRLGAPSRPRLPERPHVSVG
ncbi:carboxymuconolactone decarboxylase family protein [Pseudonocardia acaciae]|uniref:carboxymuconolactone decarboxylase family protein n=1 Tax=Pseudonocardia acaciae TaxID=551276 RepID=UPI00048D3CDC|nr:carboxymuconolactone decarboxylase family protein [Pseudonocardia acaciae]